MRHNRQLWLIRAARPCPCIGQSRRHRHPHLLRSNNNNHPPRLSNIHLPLPILPLLSQHPRIRHPSSSNKPRPNNKLPNLHSPDRMQPLNKPQRLCRQQILLQIHLQRRARLYAPSMRRFERRLVRLTICRLRHSNTSFNRDERWNQCMIREWVDRRRDTCHLHHRQ